MSVSQTVLESTQGSARRPEMRAGVYRGAGRVAAEFVPVPEIAAGEVLIRVAACGWFTTVLGPGSDAAHAEHLHVDILQHGSSDRYRICQ